MEKPCEICGDVGWLVAIRVCSKCKITREHAYCMKVPYHGDSEEWVCEECETPNHKSLLKPVPAQTDTAGTRFNIKTPPSNTKTKYLAIDEVMGLGSGTVKNISSSSQPPSVSFRPSFNVSSPRKEPPKLVAKPNPRIGPPGRTKSLNLGSIPSSSTCSSLLMSRDKGKRVAEEQNVKLSPARTGFGARYNRVSNFPASKEKKKNSSRYNEWDDQSLERPSPSAKRLKSNGSKYKIDSEDSSRQAVQGLAAASSGLHVYPNPQPRHINSERREPAEVVIKLDKYLPNHPTASPIWKGNFEIASDVVPSGIIDGIQAHPPCKVQKRTLKLSKVLPKSIKFDLLPRLNLLTDLFEDDVPVGLDIGLYFFPSKRNEHAYVCLVEYLNQNDRLLKAHIDGVDMLIISSRHLEDNSQRINKKYFLWGLFRASKESMVISTSTSASKESIFAQNLKTEVKARVAATSDRANRHDNHSQTGFLEGVKKLPMEDSMVEDMDIDMIGGQNIVIPDSVVDKPKEVELKTPEKKPTDTVCVLPTLEVKKEPNFTTSSFDELQREFDRKLQESFHRFAEFYQKREAAARVAVKLEVKTGGESLGTEDGNLTFLKNSRD